VSFHSPALLGDNMHRSFNLLWENLTTPPHVCTNGPTFTAKVINPSDRYNAMVQLDATTLVAIGHGQSGATPTSTTKSTDGGLTWAAAGTLPNYSQFSVCAVAYDGVARIVAAPNGAFFGTWFSDDAGATWTLTSPGAGFSPTDVSYGGGLFVYTGTTTANLYASANGVGVGTFTAPATVALAFWNGSLWIVVEAGGTGRVWSTPDLVTYTLRGNLASPITQATRAKVAINGSTVVLGATSDGVHAQYSLDGGFTWALTNAFTGGTSFTSAAFGAGIFLLNDSLGGIVYISTDGGLTFATSPNGGMTMTKTWSVLYTGTNFVGVGAAGSNDTVANFGVC